MKSRKQKKNEKLQVQAAVLSGGELPALSSVEQLVQQQQPADESALEWTKKSKGGFSLLDEVHGEVAEADNAATTSATPAATPAAIKPPPKQKGPKKPEPKVTEQDDLDDLFAEFDPNKCATCRVTVNTFASASFVCTFCKRNYCVQHRNAVLHGCAADHKVFEMDTYDTQLDISLVFLGGWSSSFEGWAHRTQSATPEDGAAQGAATKETRGSQANKDCEKTRKEELTNTL